MSGEEDAVETDKEGLGSRWIGYIVPAGRVGFEEVFGICPTKEKGRVKFFSRIGQKLSSGNNDSYAGDYKIVPGGKFLADTAEEFYSTLSFYPLLRP